MCGFGTLFQVTFLHTAGGNLKTHSDLKEKSLVSLSKVENEFPIDFYEQSH